MKNISKTLLSAASFMLSLFVATSCNNEIIEEIANSSEVKMVSVTVEASSTQSRVSHTEGENGDIELKWEEGDVIYAGIPQAGKSATDEVHFNETVGNITYTPQSLGFYPLTAQSVSEDGKTAVFSGEVPENFSGQSVTMAYGCDDVLVYHNSGCLLLEAKSKVSDYKNPLSNLKGYDAMSATVDNFSIESVNKVHFSHEFALFKLTLDLSAVTGEKKFKSLEITNAGGAVFTSRKVAGGTQPEGLTLTSNNYIVEFSSDAAAAESQDVYMFMSLDETNYKSASTFNLKLNKIDGISYLTSSFKGGDEIFVPGNLYNGPEVKFTTIISDYYIVYKADEKLVPGAEFLTHLYDAEKKEGTMYFSTSEVPEKLFFQNSKIKGVSFSRAITTIQIQAFQKCTSLSEINFAMDGSLTEILDGTFANCTAFTGTLNIPNSVVKIGMNAFNGVSNMKGLEIGIDSNVETIGYMSFNGCVSIENKVVLPASLKTIGGSMFGGAMKSNEFELEIHAIVPPETGASSICNVNTLKALYVPEASLSQYRATKWAGACDTAGKLKAIPQAK